MDGVFLQLIIVAFCRVDNISKKWSAVEIIRTVIAILKDNICLLLLLLLLFSFLAVVPYGSKWCSTCNVILLCNVWFIGVVLMIWCCNFLIATKKDNHIIKLLRPKSKGKQLLNNYKDRQVEVKIWFTLLNYYETNYCMWKVNVHINIKYCVS